MQPRFFIKSINALVVNLRAVSTPFFEPVINWKFKFAEISLSISKGLDYLATDADDLSCNLPSIAMTTLLTGLYLQTSKHQGCLPDSFY